MERNRRQKLRTGSALQRGVASMQSSLGQRAHFSPEALLRCRASAGGMRLAALRWRHPIIDV
jgi:hypothetical protein